ncbi:hypothetical protein [Methylobacterium planeticum]|uniref:hypothetical protein n=1 Tax=Methylobacterium planeticum TaxID=2615211 RepID=UPI001783A62C|nr:hypothetical protein [Methylobacterium planeticum]
MADPAKRRPARIPSKPLPRSGEREIALPFVALIDRDGTVTGLFRRPDEVRAYLQGGHA